MDAPIQHAGTVSASSNGSRKDSIQYIQHVQNSIERCLMLYMNRDEVVKTLWTREKIDPEFTSIVWQRLEEQNKDFFKAYYLKLILKNQQVDLMKNLPVPPKIPVAPTPNGVHPKAPVMGYPVQQHPQMHVPGHPHVVQGVHAPANLQPLRMNSTNDMDDATTPKVIDLTVDDATTPKVIDLTVDDATTPKVIDLTVDDATTPKVIDLTVDDATTPKVIDLTVDEATTPQVITPNSGGGLSEMASVASPSSVASNMVMDTSMVDSDVGGGGGAGDSRDLFDQLDWHLSLSDLSKLGDFGSPYLPSESQLEEGLDKLLDDVPEPSDEDKP